MLDKAAARLSKAILAVGVDAIAAAIANPLFRGVRKAASGLRNIIKSGAKIERVASPIPGVMTAVSGVGAVTAPARFTALRDARFAPKAPSLPLLGRALRDRRGNVEALEKIRADGGEAHSAAASPHRLDPAGTRQGVRDLHEMRFGDVEGTRNLGDGDEAVAAGGQDQQHAQGIVREQGESNGYLRGMMPNPGPGPLRICAYCPGRPPPIRYICNISLGRGP